MNSSQKDLNKTKKTDRTRGYFMDAAKEMILEEGFEAVSVRKVASKAGYAYPTLYHYFKDANELLACTKTQMISELVQSLMQKLPQGAYTTRDMKLLFRTYVSYYLENPNVFRFFYFHPQSNPQAGLGTDEPQSFDGLMRNAFADMVTTGRLTEKLAQLLAHTIVYTMHGMLTLYFSEQTNEAPQADKTRADALLHSLDEIADFLIEKA